MSFSLGLNVSELVLGCATRLLRGDRPYRNGGTNPEHFPPAGAHRGQGNCATCRVSVSWRPEKAGTRVQICGLGFALFAKSLTLLT
jgi:hypothetical protein